jgi:hypothetical protein
MRNLLEEFLVVHGKSKPKILGAREHIFTGRLVFFLLADYLVLFTVLQKLE